MIPKTGFWTIPKNVDTEPTIESINESSGEHEWIPDRNQLIAVLNSAGQQNLELIFDYLILIFTGAFNAHYSGQVMPNAKKLYSFVRWIIDKFERYQKANPNYVKMLNNHNFSKLNH